MEIFIDILMQISLSLSLSLFISLSLYPLSFTHTIIHTHKPLWLYQQSLSLSLSITVVALQASYHRNEIFPKVPLCRQFSLNIDLMGKMKMMTAMTFLLQLVHKILSNLFSCCCGTRFGGGGGHTDVKVYFKCKIFFCF